MDLSEIPPEKLAKILGNPKLAPMPPITPIVEDGRSSRSLAVVEPVPGGAGGRVYSGGLSGGGGDAVITSTSATGPQKNGEEGYPKGNGPKQNGKRFGKNKEGGNEPGSFKRQQEGGGRGRWNKGDYQQQKEKGGYQQQRKNRNHGQGFGNRADTASFSSGGAEYYNSSLSNASRSLSSASLNTAGNKRGGKQSPSLPSKSELVASFINQFCSDTPPAPTPSSTQRPTDKHSQLMGATATASKEMPLEEDTAFQGGHQQKHRHPGGGFGARADNTSFSNGGAAGRLYPSRSDGPRNLPSFSLNTAANKGGGKQGSSFSSKDGLLNGMINQFCSNTPPAPISTSVQKTTTDDKHSQLLESANHEFKEVPVEKIADNVPVKHVFTVDDISQSLGSISVDGTATGSKPKLSSSDLKLSKTTDFQDLCEVFNKWTPASNEQSTKMPTTTSSGATAATSVMNPPSIPLTTVVFTMPTLTKPAANVVENPSSVLNVPESQSVADHQVPSSGNQSMLKLFNEYKQKRDAALQKAMAEEKSKINAPTKGLFNRQKVPRAILEQASQLPIHSKMAELIELVKQNQFVIVIGEPGSGKSTQIPQYLAEAGFHGTGKIGVTQPRRVAAKSLAERVAVECGVKLGSSVGYAVRFENKVSKATVIKYMTDGLLLKECITEAALDTYSVIMIDEAHERSVHTDVCFGLLKREAKKRPDLRVIISSATLEKEKFSKFFNNAPVFYVPGSGFEVEIIYKLMTQPEYDYKQGAVHTIANIHRREPHGDILVFLPGQEEIEQVWGLLDRKMGQLRSSLWIVPCCGTMSLEEQQKIFEVAPPGTRKVVLATNIAETSLTIDGIAYVVDCGLFKQQEYDHRRRITSLAILPITKFQAIQRAGRAGRNPGGKCYRLYEEIDFKSRMKTAISPEITRCNMESVLLDIISMGIPNPLEFEFMDPPPQEALMEAMLHLQELSAVDSGLELTQLGRLMSEFPLDPPLAKVVLESEKLGCSAQVLKIVALLSAQYKSLFSRSKQDRKFSDESLAKFGHEDGDMLTLLQVYEAWEASKWSEDWCKSLYIQYSHLLEAKEIRKQLQDILHHIRGMTQGFQAVSPCPDSAVSENVRRAFTAGYFRQLAKKKEVGQAYQTGEVGNIQEVYLHPSSCLFKQKPRWLIYYEVMTTTKTFVRGLIPVDPNWISEYASDYASKITA